jgi:SNF2 family DNA or RNA helicase
VNKLLQICSGFAYRHETDEPAYHFKQNAKLAELKEVLEEIGNQRVIIWTAFKEEVEIIREFIIKHRRDKVLEVPLGYQITGDTPQRDRQPIVDAFNRNQCQYLICHPACAGEGLTILAPYAVYYSRGWKLGERLQSLGRNDRPGSEQFDNLTVIDLVCPGTVDDEVMKALSDKKDLLDTINPRSFKEMMK